MAYDTEQLRAIKKYADDNNAVPQLSVFPTVRFKLRDSGETVEVNIMTLVGRLKASKR